MPVRMICGHLVEMLIDDAQRWTTTTERPSGTGLSDFLCDDCESTRIVRARRFALEVADAGCGGLVGTAAQQRAAEPIREMVMAWAARVADREHRVIAQLRRRGKDDLALLHEQSRAMLVRLLGRACQAGWYLDFRGMLRSDPAGPLIMFLTPDEKPVWKTLPREPAYGRIWWEDRESQRVGIHPHLYAHALTDSSDTDDLVEVDPDTEAFAIDPLVWWEQGFPATLSSTTTDDELEHLAEAAQAEAAVFIPHRFAYLVDPERCLARQRRTLQEES
jgi:hypothetical protein